MNIQQTVEYFHLVFLLSISRKIDRKYYILKGGANLRFFFRSPRYSEDIDFDLQDIPVGTFREQVDAILKSQAFKDILSVKKISVEHVTPHKQTSTTQRWKIGLNNGRVSAAPISTKIEFSRRHVEEKSAVKFEPVSASILAGYQLPPVLVNHYSAETAFMQKLDAIASRKVTQARDIFDAYLLISSNTLEGCAPKNITQFMLSEIRGNIFSIGYPAFKSQVVSYLNPDDINVYDTEELWDTMRLKVIESLEKTRQT